MAIITEDYVSFEIAKLLKEKGFNESTIAFYVNQELYVLGNVELQGRVDLCTKAPSLQMAMKWLREVHKLYIEVYIVKNYSNKTVEYCITIEDLNFPSSDDGFDIGPFHESYEDATEAAIKYCLEHLI